MSEGIPLTDLDRQPWLERLRKLIEANLSKSQSLVVACSALKQRYRELLRSDSTQIRLVYLKGNSELITSRVQSRTHPDMRSEMLPSQFEALEEPRDAIVMDISLPMDEIVGKITSELAAHD